MFKANAKYIVLGLLVLMLIGAGYVNYRFSASKKEADTAVTDVDAGVIADAQSTDLAKATQTPIKSPEATVSATATPKANENMENTENALDTVLGNAGASNFFASFRAQRDSTRAKEVEYLDSIITNENSDKDKLKEAQDQKIELTRIMEKEMVIEGMIKAKGIGDAVVTIRTGSINVVVSLDKITDAQAAQILSIVQRETGESAQNIKIIPNG
ncbi:MAG: SpoIIIAH-like family protein [Bacillota bacterium]